jgi:hypothetical protein
MLLLPYVTSAPGRFQEEARATLREAIAAGQAEGSVRTGDPALLAATTETAGRGLVLAARSLDDAQREAPKRRSSPQGATRGGDGLACAWAPGSLVVCRRRLVRAG